MALLPSIATAQASPLPAVKAAGMGPGSPDCPPDATLKEVKVPDPNDFTKYSKCSFFFSAKFSCPEGEVFDPIGLECEVPKPDDLGKYCSSADEELDPAALKCVAAKPKEDEPSEEQPEEGAEESPQVGAGLSPAGNAAREA
ncbi:carbohydrate-binding module family 14 protein [Streptomyces sp. BH105]|uniref:carbohydrate-binding module family 14 protein n=1 Tax=Streptomyces sp. BH105 TaxID=3410408 RepID=UPI003CEDA0C5